jgi:hypothetical protein
LKEICQKAICWNSEIYLHSILQKKARLAVDKAMAERKITLADIKKASEEIIENRTAYLKKIRNEGNY